MSPFLDETLRLSPLLSDRSRALVAELHAHPAAPAWNHAAGDRLTHADLPALAAFTAALARGRDGRASRLPAAHLLAWAADRVAATPLLRRRFGDPASLAGRWAELPTTSREDLAREAHRLVPDDAPLERMIVYRTAGTTGHALKVPHHPLAVACYAPLLTHALARYGREPQFHDRMTAAFLVGCQRETVTYSTALTPWACLLITNPVGNYPLPASKTDPMRNASIRS